MLLVLLWVLSAVLLLQGYCCRMLRLLRVLCVLQLLRLLRLL